MKIKEVYEKYKHLDHLLSDQKWVGDNLKDSILYELWQAVKEDVEVIDDKEWRDLEIDRARRLRMERYEEYRAEVIKKRVEADNQVCRCGHKHKDHSESCSINYTAGKCTKCDCANFVIFKEGKMIKRYRKKPVVIEAIRWTGTNLKEVKEFAGGNIGYEEVCSGERLLTVTTLESNKNVNTKHCALVGDYIIKGIEGEFYPCKPDIFNKTYEEVTQPEKEGR